MICKTGTRCSASQLRSCLFDKAAAGEFSTALSFPLKGLEHGQSIILYVRIVSKFIPVPGLCRHPSHIMPPSPQWETCNVSCKLGGTRWPHAVPALVNPSRGHSGTCWSLWLRCFNTIYALLGGWLQQIISEILDILQPGSEHPTPACGSGFTGDAFTFARICTKKDYHVKYIESTLSHSVFSNSLNLKH